MEVGSGVVGELNFRKALTYAITYCLFLCLFIQELLRAKQRVLEAASERGLLQAALARPTYPTGAQVTGPYPNTDSQYAVECGPLTKEQIEQVCKEIRI